MRRQRPHRRRRRHRRAEEVALVAVTNRREIDRPLDEALGPHERRGAQRGGSARRRRDARADAARRQPVRARVRPVRVAARPPELDRLVRREDVVAVSGDDDGLLHPVGVELQPSRDRRRDPDPRRPARAARRGPSPRRARRSSGRPRRRARAACHLPRRRTPAGSTTPDAERRRHERDETERAGSGPRAGQTTSILSRHRQIAPATQPPVGDSAFRWISERARLPAVDGDAGAGDPAGARRAEERDDVGDLLGAAEAPERDLARDEGGDALGIGLLPAVPAAARETGSSRARR